MRGIQRGKLNKIDFCREIGGIHHHVLEDAVRDGALRVPDRLIARYANLMLPEEAPAPLFRHVQRHGYLRGAIALRGHLA